mmetsp:Transcript_6384/g.19018  ORF Transcript_6384/g.19018 Transcript_6384/m.19018 type:complete len:222 (+) Transcript_6384:1239-1904(+)
MASVGGGTAYGDFPSKTRFNAITPPARSSGRPPDARSFRFNAVSRANDNGDQGRNPSRTSEGSCNSSISLSYISVGSAETFNVSGSVFESSSAKRRSFSLDVLLFAYDFHRSLHASRISASQRKDEYGSLTTGNGTIPPTICSGKLTSNRGKTNPGESHNQTPLANRNVCKVLVCPGVAFTETALRPSKVFIMEDLPTFGCPTSATTHSSLGASSFSSSSP